MQSETNIYGGEAGREGQQFNIKKKRFKGWGFFKGIKGKDKLKRQGINKLQHVH